MALGLTLADAGEYTAALDWFEYAYAYQLPEGQRRIFPGLERESHLQSSYGRSITWPADGTNPHEVARTRKNAYTRFTVVSIVRCLLGYADAEYVRGSAAANARAQALYETALDLVRSDDAASEVGLTVPFPANPVRDQLETYARASLAKIHRGLNIAALDAAEDVSVQPSQYRFGVLVERAKSLVGTAGQIEGAFLAAAERADAEASTLQQASRDLEVAQAMLTEADFKVTAAAFGSQQAAAQLTRAGIEGDHYSRLIVGGLNAHERNQLNQLEIARDLAKIGTGLGVFGKLASPTPDPLGGFGQLMSGLSQAAQLDAQLDQAQASFERRAEEWQLRQALARQDGEIARAQVAQAAVQEQIVAQERHVAGIQLDHAAATAEFLATKFTSAELFQWMSGVLNEVYAYFLRQATAVARLAQAQLAFERQEPSLAVVQADYWQGTPAGDAPSGIGPDRRGLTGSERLLADLTRLEQYAFDTDRRKLHLTQTLSLARIAATELQQLRQTGVMTFATPSDLFDRRFPGHYLRLVKRLRLSLVALVPPVTGVSATLSTAGLSRTVTAGGGFRTTTLRREPESIAFTASANATGLFELEPDTGLLLPFEGMGVDTVWQLELPRPANSLDYRTIADVLLTIEYTALHDPEYRRTTVRALDRRYAADRLFSVRDQFPDAWFDLNNPDAVDPDRRMRVVLPLVREDFPANVTDLSVAELTLFVVRSDELTRELTVVSSRHTLDGEAATAGPVTTADGVVSSRRGNGESWRPLLGGDPTGTWELQLPDTAQVRSWFTDGRVRDLALVMTLSGSTPPWPV